MNDREDQEDNLVRVPTTFIGGPSLQSKVDFVQKRRAAEFYFPELPFANNSILRQLMIHRNSEQD